jgi:hypothetical protein
MVVGHKGHLLRSGTKYHDSRSSFDQYQSQSQRSNVPQVAVENASVMNSATPQEDATMSTMTIRPPMSTSPSGNQVMGENEPDGTVSKLKQDSNEEGEGKQEEGTKDKEEKENQGEAKDAIPPLTPIPPQSQLQSIPSLNTSVVDSKDTQTQAVHGLGLQSSAEVNGGNNGEEEKGEEESPSRVMGTHRFSVLNKDLLELHENNPKKKGGSKTCEPFSPSHNDL